MTASEGHPRAIRGPPEGHSKSQKFVGETNSLSDADRVGRVGSRAGRLSPRGKGSGRTVDGDARGGGRVGESDRVNGCLSVVGCLCFFAFEESFHRGRAIA